MQIMCGLKTMWLKYESVENHDALSLYGLNHGLVAMQISPKFNPYIVWVKAG